MKWLLWRLNAGGVPNGQSGAAAYLSKNKGNYG